MKNSIFAAVTATSLLVFSGALQAATVGNAVSDRQYADGYSNFGFASTNDIFGSGTITGWSTWVESINGGASSGSLGLMVLESVAGLGANEFRVKAVDTQSVSVGLNSFISSIAVSAGDFLGFYMANAKISYDNGGSVDNYSANNLFSSDPSIGSTYTFGGMTERTYSISATVGSTNSFSEGVPAPVPLPASLPLVLAGLSVLGYVGRKRRKVS